MTATWPVRRLGEEEWELYRAVRLAMLLDSPAAYGSSYAREAAFDEGTWRSRLGQRVLVVERGGGLPLGTATFLRLDPGDDPEIVAMWVAGHARGHGVADALVGRCLEEAAADGDEVLRLHVMLDNPRAVAFYGRAGFARDGGWGDAPGCARMAAAVHEILPDR